MSREKRHVNPYIHQVHIADGFADDCEELIHRWLKTETLTYETFCEVWKDLQLGYVYHGRSSGAEMAELSEELICIAKHYMVANTCNFEESIAGVFLVYAILNLQPYPGFAPLRIVPDDIPAINRIEMVARRQKRYDVLYILGSMLIEGPVQYHVDTRERGMESSIRKYLEGYTGIDQLGVRPKGVLYRQNEELDLLRELNVVTKRYAEAKMNIKGASTSKDLKYFNPKLAVELDSSFKKVINGIINKDEESNIEITNHYSAVQAIKDKAMRQNVDGVKFLQSAQNNQTLERKKEEKKVEKRKKGEKRKKEEKKKGEKKKEEKMRSPKKQSPKMKCGIVGIETPEIIKQYSPKKVVTGFRKRKATKSKRRVKKKKRNASTSSSDSLNISNLSSDNNDKSDGSKSDFNIDNFDKVNANEDEDLAAEEREIDIEIESLPVFIRTEQEGRMFEIDFIDECEIKLENKDSKDVNAKVKEIGEVTIIDSGEGTSKPKEENLLLKRREKRELKKTILKSKFKRQGMLNVANFNENADSHQK